MKVNVGGIDRVLRIGLGLALVGATAVGAIPAWGWVGVIPLVTGVVGFCPFYPLLKVKTCK